MAASLRLVAADAAPASPTAQLPLLAACTGTPVLLNPVDADLIALANAAPQIIDATADPDTIPAAAMVLHWYVHHTGIQRACEGARAQNLASAIGHWIIPFLDELDAAARPADRGVAALRFMQAEKLVRILEGKAPMPAATLAAARMGARRNPMTCLWLTIPEAGNVAAGGPQAVACALRDGRLTPRRTAAGTTVVRAADLRSAGLLDESAKPHGIAKDSASNVLFVVKGTIQRAANLGANVRGNFAALRAVEPLRDLRAREPRVDAGYQSLDTIHRVAAHLSVLDQSVLWMLRLTGFRIGEGYGPRVGELRRAADGARTLPVDKQGGARALVRDPKTGLFAHQEGKPSPKTTQSDRVVRLPDLLGELLEQVIEIYHTDTDGNVNLDARLIPGLGKQDAAGAGSFRRHLDEAIRLAGVARFTPHDLRGMLTTDLMNAGVEQRVQEYYVGHLDSRKTVHESYDDGVPTELQAPATEALADLLQTTGIEELIAPTDTVENWGTRTPHYARREAITEALRARGWLAEPTSIGGARLLKGGEVADRLGLSETEVRRRCQRGDLPAQLRPWGTRRVWMVAEDALDAWVAAHTGTTIDHLAAELHLPYHQVWRLARALGAFPQNRAPGQAIVLDEDQARQVRQAVVDTRTAASDVIDLQGAANRLHLPLGQVEKLVRNGQLKLAASPTGSRRRYVSLDSVQAFEATRHLARTRDDGRAVPIAAARAALQLTRPRASDLISTGILAATTVERRQCVLLPSAIAFAEANGIAGARAALEASAVTREPR